MSTNGQLRHAPSATGSAQILSVQGLSGGYGQVRVLRDLNLELPEGTVCALLGRNGVGKTTLLRTLAGLLRPHQGQIVFGGTDVTALAATERAAQGLCFIPEGRAVFRSLSVEENIRVFAPASMKGEAHDKVYSIFPRLGERRRNLAGQLSGGEQQMLAMSRAFLVNPKAVLVDEPSFGLGPLIIDLVFEALGVLARSGAAILLVEQYIERALALAHEVYVMDRGELTYAGEAGRLTAEEVTSRYFGVGDEAD
jgi:branched-chain amino acid transport system ATP-binding protein